MSLRLLPLGGLGEIGRNCLLVECGADALLVDCGVQFPGPDLPGVDLLLPDFAPLRRRRDKLRGVLITHGHEDHLGAVPHLLREFSLPVLASPFTLRLLERKLEEQGLKTVTRPLYPRQPVNLGGFEIEPLRVTHSIPDSLAFAIRCAAGTLLHTGDFKVDHTPLDGEVTDLPRLAELGRRGVLALLSDSTNANREGSCPGELTVGPALRALIAAAPGRVVVAMFASNLQRLQQVLELSQQLGRKVAVNGRSLESNLQLGTDMNRLAPPPGVLISLEQAATLPRRQVVIVSTGAQAEPRSGLSRLAYGTHPLLRLEPGDRVIFSASLIPGNELEVHGLCNQLARGHVDVFQEPDHPVHVSGHGYRNDQRLMLRLTRPQAFIPVHGEPRHLLAHRELALECGVPADRILEVYDGDWVELGEGVARVVGSEELGVTYLDRWGGNEVPEELVRERRSLAGAGLITALVQFDRQSGQLLRPVEIYPRGLTADDSLRLSAELRGALTEELTAMPAALKLDLPAVEEAVVATVRRLAKKMLDRRPLVVPVILRL